MAEAKVEKFKLTKEMASFSKSFKRVQQLSQVLQQGLQIQLAEADQTRRMLHETNAVREQMLQMAPKKPTNEIEGQEADVKDRYGPRDPELDSIFETYGMTAAGALRERENRQGIRDEHERSRGH